MAYFEVTAPAYASITYWVEAESADEALEKAHQGDVLHVEEGDVQMESGGWDVAEVDELPDGRGAERSK